MLLNAMFVLDVSSPGAVVLLGRVADRHSPAIASAAGLPTRIFGLQSPFARNLCFIGAEVDPGRVVPGAPPMHVLHLAGTGVELEDALASCLGECVERVSQIEHPGEQLQRRVWRDAKPEVAPSAAETVEDLVTRTDCADVPIAWMKGRLLACGSPVLVPADWCLRRGPGSLLGIPGAALSTGCAAGRTYASAAVSAVLELVERDAIAHWWVAGRRGKPLANDGAAAGEAASLLARLRGDGASRRSWLLDISTDLPVPCIAAISVDRDGRGLACGFAARRSCAAAARSALLEMCQMELALALARSKQERMGEETLTAGDRRQLALGSQISADACDLLHADGLPIPWAEPTNSATAEDHLAVLRGELGARGIEAVLVDLSRANLRLATVFAVAPGLQMLPSALVSPRLERAMKMYGGGARWTNNLSLF